MVMVITDKQRAIFENYSQQRFIETLYHHCESSAPYRTKITGKANLFAILRRFFDETKQRGLEKSASFHLYLGLSLTLGGLFYDDIQYVSIMKTFNENRYLIEFQRIEQLYQNVVDYIQQVVGENNDYLKTAIERLGQIEAFHLKETAFSSEMMAILDCFYPQKVEFVGQETYQSLISWGKNRAQNVYSFDQPNQWATYTMLMFFLGQHFDRDPFASWLNWSEQIEKIRTNQFNFAELSHQLMMIWALNKDTNDVESNS